MYARSESSLCPSAEFWFVLFQCVHSVTITGLIAYILLTDSPLDLSALIAVGCLLLSLFW